VEQTNKIEKIKIEFDGWHVLSKQDNKDILDEARLCFKNANFIDNCGLIVEALQQDKVLLFCLEILEKYKDVFKSWDGYSIRKLSKRTLYNYQDKKRKLSFIFFKKLISENNFDDINLIIAGTLYLKTQRTKIILSTIERDLNKSLFEMNEKELEVAYNLLLKYSSTIERKLL
jgi:hypothetical protein